MEAIRLESTRLGVALLTIDRAAHFNTLSVATLEALDATLRLIAGDAATRAVVVAGAGGESFAAGANIREFAGLSPREAISFAARGQRVFDRIERMPQAVFAAIDGYCLGGGLDLALACDVRIASTRSVFAHPGSRLGIMTGFGGTQRMARLIGVSRALELFASARRIDATEAHSIGLVDAIDDAPAATALSAGAAVARNVDAVAIKAVAIGAWRR